MIGPSTADGLHTMAAEAKGTKSAMKTEYIVEYDKASLNRKFQKAYCDFVDGKEKVTPYRVELYSPRPTLPTNCLKHQKDELVENYGVDALWTQFVVAAITSIAFMWYGLSQLHIVDSQIRSPKTSCIAQTKTLQTLSLRSRGSRSHSGPGCLESVGGHELPSFVQQQLDTLTFPDAVPFPG
jgi:hypothetical protein